MSVTLTNEQYKELAQCAQRMQRIIEEGVLIEPSDVEPSMATAANKPEMGGYQQRLELLVEEMKKRNVASSEAPQVRTEP